MKQFCQIIAAILVMAGLQASTSLALSSAAGTSERKIASLGERTLVQAISLINSGDEKKAYNLLEKNFPKAKQKLDKARMALLLAVSKPTHKLQRPRYRYAQYAEENHLALDDEMRRRLIRIRADSYFESKLVSRAKHAYQELLSHGQATTDEKEYATYRLGWTYINERHPDRAFRLWQNWLLRYRDGRLRNRILKDLGQVWSESLRKGQNTFVRLELKEQDSSKLFLQGVVQDLENNQRKSHELKLSAALKPIGLTEQFKRVLKAKEQSSGGRQ